MHGTYKLLPLLLLYVLLILVFAPSGLARDDETLYAHFAERLTHGHYSPQNDVNLWFGPGYPLILAVFDALDLSWMAARFLNAILLLVAIAYFYATLRLYTGARPALAFAYLLGLYPPFLAMVFRLYTETLVLFLVFGLIYHVCRFFQPAPRRPWAHLVVGGLYFGYLALTKVFFGYVLLAGLLLFAALYVARRQARFAYMAMLFIIALLLCIPYLVYTYNLTGRAYYWGNSGGMSLYWISSPYEDELGDWHTGSHFNSREFLDVENEMAEHHQTFFNEVMELPSLERDAAFQRRALENIRDHPIKYLQNVAANIGRLVFNYPYSYTPQKLSTYAYILPNVFLVALAAFSLYPTWVARRRIPFEIYALLAIAVVAFGGSALLSAFNRQLVPIVPFLALWLAYIWTCVVRLEIRTVPEAATE